MVHWMIFFLHDPMHPNEVSCICSNKSAPELILPVPDGVEGLVTIAKQKQHPCAETAHI